MNKVFLDFEMNRISRQHRDLWKKCRNEIIEIGAVKVNEANEIIDSFKRYVRPEFNTRIADDVYQLTKISIQMVFEGDLLEKVMNEFADWCGEDCEIYSWSDYDLYQVRKEYDLKGIQISERLNTLMEHWIDYQKQFGEICHTEQALSLEKAVMIAGIDFTGRAHDGLTDAWNTAQIYIRSQDGIEFSKIKNILDDAFADHSFSMGDFFNFDKLQLAC